MNWATPPPSAERLTHRTVFAKANALNRPLPCRPRGIRPPGVFRIASLTESPIVSNALSSRSKGMPWPSPRTRGPATPRPAGSISTATALEVASAS